MEPKQGGCLCGRVRYAIRGETSQVTACHCSQCARASGHFAAMARCRTADLAIIDDAGSLCWFASSASVRRGFCSNCGGNLFWHDTSSDDSYVTAGTLDRPTGLKMAEHIFADSKSDYYDIADDLPQMARW